MEGEKNRQIKCDHLEIVLVDNEAPAYRFFLAQYKYTFHARAVSWMMIRSTQDVNQLKQNQNT